MFKKIIVLLAVIIIPVQVYAMSQSDDEVEEIEDIIELAEHDLRFDSNNFTRPEIDSDNERANQSLDGYIPIAENEQLRLYVEENTLAIKVENVQTGYIWSSGLDEPDDYRLNETWTNMAQSAVTIDYLDVRSNNQTANVAADGAVSELTMTDHGFEAVVQFEDAGIELYLHVEIQDGELFVHVPQEGITEEEESGQLLSLRLYPFLGASHQNGMDGYLFIPDGSGALIRFEENPPVVDAPFRSHIYGRDEAYRRTLSSEQEDSAVIPAHTLSLPVYGVVHGSGENGFITVVEDGSHYGEVLAYPSGVSTDFYWVTSQYHYRYEYFQPTSRDLSGFTAYQEDRNDFDITQRISFLSDEDADYVGMAKTYQSYLFENDRLNSREDVVDVRLEFLGGEAKAGVLRDTVIPMTPVTDIEDHVRELQKEGADSLHVVYRGWTEGGLTGALPAKFPYESSLGSGADFTNTRAALEDMGVPMSFYTDFTKAYEGAAGFGGRSEVARRISGEPVIQEDGYESSFYLRPGQSLEYAGQDIEQFKEHGIEHISVDTSGQVLFSDYTRAAPSSRNDMIGMYDQLFSDLSENMNGISFYNPNDYVWEYTDRYLDIPMYSSSYLLTTDTIPFIQIVLKGHVPYYAPYSNFNHNPQEELLRMIEFGAYPSFYLTTKSSNELVDTPSRHLYTSRFDDWKDEVVRQYDEVHKSLGMVENETIVSRTVHEPGVVEVGYSNDLSIVVNYTSEQVQVDGVNIEPSYFGVINKEEGS
ncbi:DUF5696 domain-containing protein [Alteribacter aurantiacus]|uniref:DUF5696 domain-containing protein n=1 Tax=Alteribacter aurantiacus TaxID=254410 RepID=UPI0004035FC4|nr:DUF5696 domain-containing protein [Alteribacter aurantiacus]